LLEVEEEEDERALPVEGKKSVGAMICWRLKKKRMKELFPWKGKEEVKNEALSWKGPLLSHL
jgi:hypothetical protein